MAYVFSDVNKGFGVREILAFTTANNSEEARAKMKPFTRNYTRISIGIDELQTKKELENRKSQIIAEIKELEKAEEKIRKRKILLRSIRSLN